MFIWSGHTPARGRQILSWTKTHGYTRPLAGTCDRCGQKITFGSYTREVWVFPSTRYGFEFVVKRIHDEPICPVDREYP